MKTFIAESSERQQWERAAREAQRDYRRSLILGRFWGAGTRTLRRVRHWLIRRVLTPLGLAPSALYYGPRRGGRR